jgi:hypothetical protein
LFYAITGPYFFRNVSCQALLGGPCNEHTEQIRILRVVAPLLAGGSVADEFLHVAHGRIQTRGPRVQLTADRYAWISLRLRCSNPGRDHFYAKFNGAVQVLRRDGLLQERVTQVLGFA